MDYSSARAVSDLDPAPVPDARRGPADLLRSRIARALKLSPVLAQAERSAREAMLNEASVEVVLSGAVIFEQGAQADSLFVLGRGRRFRRPLV